MATTATARKRDSEATKQRILAAAVKHFGLYGFGGASLRNILADADASLASANYHFGSKANLLVAAIDHYIVRTHERRFELLEAARKLPPVKPRVYALIEAYLRPHIEISLGKGGQDYARFITKVLSEDTSTMQTEIDNALLPIRRRFREELRICCPGVDDQQLAKGIGFVVSILAMAPFRVKPDTLAIRPMKSAGAETVLADATRFACGGFVELLGLRDEEENE